MTNKIGNLEGMTVNERLYVTHQLREFDGAVARRDLDRIRYILKSIHVDETAINSMVRNVETFGTAHDPTWRPT
jgi:hypothetical protein